MARRALPVSRRSFVALVTGAAAASIVSAPALAQRTDSDPTDPAGAGRTTGITDNDPTDEAGNGRGNSGLTDSDSGANADCANRGRGNATGETDSDSGNGADQAGNGRSGLSDSDVNDAAGYGRGRGSCPA